jgi:uncharacterized protein (TIGR03067 family)
MNLTLILGVAVGVSAPTLKDPPKKEATIVGEWTVESIKQGGKENCNSCAGLSYEFTVEGQWLMRRDGATIKITPNEYMLNPKADPPTIDVTPRAVPGPALPRAQRMIGIYKIEGDTLTICFADGEERPTKFESPDGSRDVLVVLKRLKKKD